MNCSTHNFEMVKMKMSNGRWMLKKQCPTCGKTDSPHLSHKGFNIAKVPMFNKELYENYLTIKIAESENKRAKWKVDRLKYISYLESPEWRAKRQVIFERDGRKCVLCGEDGIQVHHLTYDRIGHEDNDDLISVCLNCHAKIHGK